jgi:hypothetical protein
MTSNENDSLTLKISASIQAQLEVHPIVCALILKRLEELLIQYAINANDQCMHVKNIQMVKIQRVRSILVRLLGPSESQQIEGAYSVLQSCVKVEIDEVGDSPTRAHADCEARVSLVDCTVC